MPQKKICISEDEAKRMCCKDIRKSDSLQFQVVYGRAGKLFIWHRVILLFIYFCLKGSGKTHYIKKNLLKCSESITITINESFSALKAIDKLSTLSTTKQNVGLFFNITLPPKVSLLWFHSAYKLIKHFWYQGFFGGH